MSLWSQLRAELAHKKQKAFSGKKADSALKTLEKVFGGGYVLPNPEAQTAEIVNVPGSTQKWVVFGRWDDGTLDIIQEGGMFSRDVLTGWRPGQSVAEYNKALQEEFPDVDEKNPSAGGEGEKSKAGAGGPLSIVSGSGFRRSKRGGRKPGRLTGDHSGGKKAKTDSRPRASTTSPRLVAEAVVPSSDSKGKS